MTPTDETRFIQLWVQGASYRAIAQALRCPIGTVASRSAALAAQGKIQPRPRGGAKARPAAPPVPVQRPVQTIDTGAVQSVDTGAVQAISTEVEQLKAEVQGLRLIVQSVVERLDGMISNDQFCCTRWGVLQLSWWRRPNRLRR
jgi:DNA-binding transcriptional MocR family regulator